MRVHHVCDTLEICGSPRISSFAARGSFQLNSDGLKHLFYAPLHGHFTKESTDLRGHPVINYHFHILSFLLPLPLKVIEG